MQITKEQVRHVAKLARLQITEQDLDKLSGKIASILAYMDKLNQVDTTNVPATSHAIERSNAFREDRVHEHLPREKALANAPGQSQGSFVVPKVI